MAWAEQAEELREAITETGVETAAISAAAWRAGVGVAATESLTTAAVAMWANPLDLLSGGLAPLPSDREMLAQAEDAVTPVGEHLAATRALSDRVTAAARAAATAAENARGRASSEDAATARSAEADLCKALAELADCEEAIGLLADTSTRLGIALDALGQVPDDLTETYELPYEHLRAGRTLPVSGMFLTGTPR